ncbi:MAG: hypothetical protein AAGJ93_17905, partial [Bacteroidota bacterium]
FLPLIHYLLALMEMLENPHVIQVYAHYHNAGSLSWERSYLREYTLSMENAWRLPHFKCVASVFSFFFSEAYNYKTEFFAGVLV